MYPEEAAFHSWLESVGSTLTKMDVDAYRGQRRAGYTGTAKGRGMSGRSICYLHREHADLLQGR